MVPPPSQTANTMYEAANQTKAEKGPQVLLAPLDQQLSDPTYASPLSIERRKEFSEWLGTNQDSLHTSFEEELGEEAPAIFVGVLHGSVGRGHATEKEGRRSDIDGTIFFNAEVTPSDPSQLEKIFPSVDWGIHFVNVHDMVQALHELDERATQQDSRGELDWGQEEIQTQFSGLAHNFACLFGHASGPHQEQLSEWRNQIFTEIAHLKTVRPSVIWNSIREEWYKNFIHFEKRSGEALESIAARLEEKGVPPQEARVQAARILKRRQDTALPSWQDIAAS